MNKYEVIYLTGHPASGKTTLVNRLRQAFSGLRVFTYSEILARHLAVKSSTKISQNTLRQKSANIVTEQDIKSVDQLLIREVKAARKSGSVIIDSHAVTKEDYGFRVTAFSFSMLENLAPTKICVLYTDSKTVIKRIRNNAGGRPTISKFEADFHCFTQVGLAVTYGIALGIPVYCLENAGKTNSAFKKLETILTTK
jgi:adenylate kinase